MALRIPKNRVGGPRVLISTSAPGPGGVDAMTRFVVNSLAMRGLDPVIAHYAPYSASPKLSVPTFRLLQRRAAAQRGLAYEDREAHAIGAWLPELEFTNYMAASYWRKLMDSCEAFVAVSGNVLSATPFEQTGRPYLAWVATDWQGDRQDRVRHFSLPRRLLDLHVNRPIIRRLEKRLLMSGRILALSDFTAQALSNIAGPEFQKTVLPMAVDTDLFVPSPGAVVHGRLGFAGRYNDPRKNIGLFLESMALLRRHGHDVTALLAGDAAGPAVTQVVERLGLGPYVRVESYLSQRALRDRMQTLDLFVLPSHQEGLCIAALEAMACGVPVVSTRCGGPEEFVTPGCTGSLVAADPHEMAGAIVSIIGDRELRSRMSMAARRVVEERYTRQRVEAIFFQAFVKAFPELGTH